MADALLEFRLDASYGSSRDTLRHQRSRRDVSNQPAVLMQQLTEQVLALHAAVDDAQQERQQLQRRLSVVASVCNALKAVRLHQHRLLQDCPAADSLQSDSAATTVAADIDLCQLLSPEELMLLHRVTHASPGSSSSSSSSPTDSRPVGSSSPAPELESQQAAAGVSCSDWPTDTLSPPNDPLQYFRTLLEHASLPSNNIIPDIDSISVAELQERYLQASQENMLQLSLLDKEQVGLQQLTHDPIAVCKGILDNFLLQWATLVLHGKGELLYHFHLRYVESCSLHA